MTVWPNADLFYLAIFTDMVERRTFFIFNFLFFHCDIHTIFSVILSIYNTNKII